MTAPARPVIVSTPTPHGPIGTVQRLHDCGGWVVETDGALWSIGWDFRGYWTTPHECAPERL